nr:CDPK-related kinase 5-like [Tanacetum cinerariifolium]
MVAISSYPIAHLSEPQYNRNVLSWDSSIQIARRKEQQEAAEELERVAQKRGIIKKLHDAMKESHVHDFLASRNVLQYRRMDFEKFCAAAINIYQLEALHFKCH